MNATPHTRLATALTLLCASLIATGCSKNHAAAASASGSAAAAPSTAAAPIVDARTALLNRVKNLPQGDSNVPDTQYAELTSGAQLAELFYAVSGMPPDYEALSSIVSEEYRTTSDEFRKRDLLQALRPKIEEQIATYKDPKNRYFRLQALNNNVIQHYDFKTSSFPVQLNVGPNDSIYFNDASKYRIGYINGDAFQRFTVTDEQRAKELESMVTKYWFRGNSALLYIFVQAADTSSNQLQAHIMRVVLNDPKRAEIARF